MDLNENETCFYHVSNYSDGTIGFTESDGGCSFRETEDGWRFIDCNYPDELKFNTLQEVIAYLKKEHPEYDHVILL